MKRVKKGIPSVQPLYGDEIRSLRKLQRDYPASPYVFQSSRLGPLARDTVSGIVERAGELAGLPVPSSRTYATAWNRLLFSQSWY